MSYLVKELFYSLQGEGLQAGRGAVFLRFSGCNLWDGRPESKAASSCSHCDTDFSGTDGDRGGVYASADALVRACAELWPGDMDDYAWCVLTGGEPALQADEALLDALHEAGFRVAIETNGSCPLPRGLDWITVSPKPGAVLVATRGDELKLLYPNGLDPRAFEALAFGAFLLQPLDTGSGNADVEAALAYCLAHPRWRLSLQMHKLIGLR